jgi:anti-anti-sigma factor
MKVEDLANDVIAFELQREPQMNGELQTVLDIANDRADCNIVLDFTKVDIITSPSLSKLLKLRQALLESGHHLILCGIHPFTRSAFMITGLDGIFELAADRQAALAAIHNLLNPAVSEE